jgi:hypothetical protein
LFFELGTIRLPCDGAAKRYYPVQKSKRFWKGGGWSRAKTHLYGSKEVVLPRQKHLCLSTRECLGWGRHASRSAAWVRSASSRFGRDSKPLGVRFKTVLPRQALPSFGIRFFGVPRVLERITTGSWPEYKYLRMKRDPFPFRLLRIHVVVLARSDHVACRARAKR